MSAVTPPAGVMPAASEDRQNGDNASKAQIRPNRKSVDHTAKGAAAMIRSLGRRIGREHDPEDLPLLSMIQEAVDEAWRLAINGLREQGRSDNSIGVALGITQQAVTQRWPRKLPVGRFKITAECRLDPGDAVEIIVHGFEREWLMTLPWTGDLHHAAAVAVAQTVLDGDDESFMIAQRGLTLQRRRREPGERHVRLIYEMELIVTEEVSR